MNKILIIMGSYLPGYKDGGPVRTIVNLVENLGDEYEFRILTSDRDHGDTHPYPNIKVDNWNTVGKSKVYYVAPDGFTMGLISRLSEEVDLIYSCGIYTRRSWNVFMAARNDKIKRPVVVAPMGMFSQNAFRIKYLKKKIYTTVLNLSGAVKKVYWSASSELEIQDIKRQLWINEDKCFIAEDMARAIDITPIYKQKGDTLHIVWISRIAEKKNLMQAVKILSAVKAKISFTIIGEIYDENYWSKCQKALGKLPDYISWNYRGVIESENVVNELRNYHVFLFPTFGENYGHVIPEALSAGCPCIISDQTPWQDLEENNVGYVFPLDDINLYVNALESYAEMNAEEFNRIGNKAVMYAARKSSEKIKDTGYRTIFNLSGGGYRKLTFVYSTVSFHFMSSCKIGMEAYGNA